MLLILQALLHGKGFVDNISHEYGVMAWKNLSEAFLLPAPVAFHREEQ